MGRRRGRLTDLKQKKNAALKLGRWRYCKSCYKNVLPRIGDGVIACAECDFGIGLLHIEGVVNCGV